MTFRRVATLWIVLLAGLACREATVRPRNVLLVSLDTVRADRIGCYGREEAGTPNLDALAHRGVRFADVTAPSPTTLPSHATLFTGHDVSRHRVRNNGMFALSPGTVTLAQRFEAAGYRTGAFYGSMVLAEHYGLARGFGSYVGPGRGDERGPLYISERSAEDVNRATAGWLDTIGTEPFFLFVHYMEAHAPYEPPEPERSRFVHDRYQGEIAAADRALGELFADLERRGRLAETLVVLVADHGESLGEHGEPNHGIFLYQSTLHVPMIAAGPGVRGGRVVAAPVGLVDVAPTLLDALALPPIEPADGQSLWPVATDTGPAPDRSIYAETFLPRYDFGWSEIRALRRGPFKYVEAPRPELYGLDRDPDESLNLLDVETAAAASLSSELAELVERVESEAQDPQRLRVSPEERRALEALGYLAGAGEPAGGGSLDDPKDHIGEASALGDAEAFIFGGDYPEAERRLRRLVEARPFHLSARTRLVFVLASQGKTEEAAAEGRAFDKAASRVPDGGRFAAQAHVVLGRMFLNEERPEDAVREYELAMLAPQPSEVYDMLAALYHDLGRPDEAIGLLRSLVERGDASPRSRRMLRALEAEGG
jgi:arylsulfatase A-like enzyme